MIKKYTVKTQLGNIPNTEWWIDKDWNQWREYVKELRRTGDFGKEVEVTYELIHSPELDESNLTFPKVNTTMQFIVFDVSNFND